MCVFECGLCVRVSLCVFREGGVVEKEYVCVNVCVFEYVLCVRVLLGGERV